jgi:hypothetical protein
VHASTDPHREATVPDSRPAVLRVEPETLPQLRDLFAGCLDLLREKLRSLERNGRMVDAWMHDPVSTRMRDLYNTHVMDAADGGYAALRAYEAELLRVHDTLAEMERNYRATDEDTAALFEGRA